MKKYVCWGEDKEDLTEQVNAAIFPIDPVAFAYAPASKAKKKSRKWRVSVACSQGHENIFEGETSSPHEHDVVLKKKPTV